MIEINGVNYELLDLNSMSPSDLTEFKALSKLIADAGPNLMSLTDEQLAELTAAFDKITRMVVPGLEDAVRQLSLVQVLTILTTATGLANAIKEVTFKGESYPVHSFRHLEEADILKMLDLFERGREAPEEVPDIVREVTSIFVPIAAERMKDWSANDVLMLLTEVYPLMNFACLSEERILRFTEGFKHVLLVSNFRILGGENPLAPLT